LRQRGDVPTRFGPVPKDRPLNLGTDALILDHITLARSLARRVASTHTSYQAEVDDMIGDALYGLVLAGRRYNEDAAVPFAPWARTHIKGAIYGGIRSRRKTRQRTPPQFVPLQDGDGI
jgi:DNA-directed RNA polymerase specialized sigma subunit